MYSNIAKEIRKEIEKANKPSVILNYGYNYGNNPSCTEDGEIPAESNFRISNTYTHKLCVADQTSETTEWTLENSQSTVDRFSLIVEFSNDAKTLVSKLNEIVLKETKKINPNYIYNDLEYCLSELKIKKNDIFSIKVNKKNA